jgi:hypothetical protein
MPFQDPSLAPFPWGFRPLPLFFGFVLTLAGPGLFAQGPTSLEPGRRVRVALAAEDAIQRRAPGQAAAVPTRRSLVGSLVEASNEVLRLRLEGTGQVVQVPRSRITRLDVSAGRRSRGVTALAGAGAGALAGGLIGAISGDDQGGGYSAGGKAITYGLLLAPVCALVGSSLGGDRWKEVPRESPGVDLGLAPVRGGMTASLSIRF